MCAVTNQEDYLNNLENPLITDLDTSFEWFEDESQFSAKKVKCFFYLF